MLQTPENPALFVTDTNISALKRTHEEWNKHLREWYEQSSKGAEGRDIKIEYDKTILTHGHLHGPSQLDSGQRALDAMIIWHETGHAVAIASGLSNTEGYAYEFELRALSYAVKSGAAATFKFTWNDVVKIITKQGRIKQYKTNSWKQETRVKNALADFREALLQAGENALADQLGLLVESFS